MGLINQREMYNMICVCYMVLILLGALGSHSHTCNTAFRYELFPKSTEGQVISGKGHPKGKLYGCSLWKRAYMRH